MKTEVQKIVDYIDANKRKSKVMISEVCRELGIATINYYEARKKAKFVDLFPAEQKALLGVKKAISNKLKQLQDAKDINPS